MSKLPEHVPLFRREVLERRAEAVFGDVLLPQPAATFWLALFSAAFFLLLIVLTFTVHIARHASVSGWLIYAPGVANVMSPKLGIVAGVLVVEGQSVKQGDPLIKIITSRSSAMSSDIETKVVEHLEDVRNSLRSRIELKGSLLQTDVRQAQEQIEASQREIPELQSLVEIGQESLKLAQNDYERNLQLVGEHLVSSSQLEESHSKLLLIQATAKSSTAKLREKLESIKSQTFELNALPLRRNIELAELKSQLASVDQNTDETLGEHETLIKSPIAGKVSTVLAVNGDSIAAGGKLMVIVPDGASLEAHILVPTRTSGFLDIGQTVKLRYDAFPYQKFGQHEGKITAISRTVISDTDNVGPIKVDEPSYLITASLPEQEIDSYGKRFLLRGGLTLQAEISAESRTIAQWAVDPLYAAGTLH